MQAQKEIDGTSMINRLVSSIQRNTHSKGRLRVRALRVFLCLIALLIISQNRRAFSDDPQATENDESKQIETWIDQLDDPRYQTRESATLHLRGRGAQAIDALLVAVKSGSLERSMRAMQIISDMAKPRDPAVDNPALAALETVASWQVASASANAKQAIREIRLAQVELAIQELLSVNVTVDHGDMMIANTRQARIHLRIPTDFKASAEDIRWVRWLYNIEDAVVQGPNIDNALLSQIARMPDLTRLVIYRATRLTNEGLLALKQAKQLQHLELNFLNLEAGTGEVVAKLPLHSLRVLGLTPIENDIETLRKLRPELSIVRSRGGFLGVKCDPGEQVCRIDGVEPGSAAEAAKLLPNDVVFKIEGESIRNYDALRETIGKYPPGQTITLEIYRRGEYIKIPLELGEIKP